MDKIDNTILLLRGERVVLDMHLARLYGVSTKRLNEQVKRNQRRFPPDFIFYLTDQEITNLKSQFATSSFADGEWGGRRKRPLAFTEHGAVMAACVLSSAHAIAVPFTSFAPSYGCATLWGCKRSSQRSSTNSSEERLR